MITPMKDNFMDLRQKNIVKSILIISCIALGYSILFLLFLGFFVLIPSILWPPNEIGAVYPQEDEWFFWFIISYAVILLVSSILNIIFCSFVLKKKIKIDSTLWKIVIWCNIFAVFQWAIWFILLPLWIILLIKKPKDNAHDDEKQIKQIKQNL